MPPITTTVISTLISAVITGVFIFWVQHNLKRQWAAQEEREREHNAAKEQNELLIHKATSAALALSEATAKSMQRLDKDCNGDMGAALTYAQAVKNEQRDFLRRQGVKNFI